MNFKSGGKMETIEELEIMLEDNDQGDYAEYPDHEY